jgi:hypothetical protein
MTLMAAGFDHLLEAGRAAEAPVPLREVDPREPQVVLAAEELLGVSLLGIELPQELLAEGEDVRFVDGAGGRGERRGHGADLT